MLADLLQAWPIAIVAILFAMGRELFKTALVWMTDAEHFFQMVMNMSAVVGVALAAGLPVSIPAAAIAFFIGNAAFGVIKETLLPNVQ